MVLIIVLLSGVLSIVAYRLGMLTHDGAVASFAIGVIVGVLGGTEWFILLMLFVAAGFAATRAGFSKKKEAGLQEGTHGERSHLNILGVGVAPCIFAALAYLTGDEYRLLVSIGFIASISVAAADTLASEIGVRDKNVWLCTTLKSVPPGTDGGVSVMGLGVSLLGAAVTSVLGWIVLHNTLGLLLIIPTISGFIGCYMDSIFGATIETDGWISKYTNNAVTGILGGVLAIFLAWPFI